MSRRTHKVEIYHANKGSGLLFFSTDLDHFSRSNVGNDFRKMLRNKGSHQPDFAYDIVHIQSLMIYTDLIEHNIFGDTKAPLVRCFPVFSKLLAENTITTGKYKNYQTFSNLQFKPLLNNSFQSIQIDLRDTSGEKILVVSVVVARFVSLFKKTSNTHF